MQIITYILFIAGFVLLIKGADYLVEGSSSIGKRLGLTSLFIGLTIVAFGTSAPELFVTVIANFQGNAELAVGTILGSNIANILLILGIIAIFYPLTVNTSTVNREIPLSLLAVIVLFILVNDHLISDDQVNILSRGDGLILLAFFVIFLYYVSSLRYREGQRMPIRLHAHWKENLMIIGGALSLTLGAKLIADCSVVLAQSWHLNQAFIGLTIIALGTSLPELATSVVAAYKGKTDIAIGNVVGSNIFRIFAVLGLNAVIRPINFSSFLNFDIIITLLATVMLLLFLYVGKKMTLQRWEGFLFLILYLAYIAFLFYRG